MNNVKYDVNDMPKPGLLVGLSFQHLFAMFGATVLVPILVGIDPAIALFSSGLGTLAHLTVTKVQKFQLTWVLALPILRLCRHL